MACTHAAFHLTSACTVLTKCWGAVLCRPVLSCAVLFGAVLHCLQGSLPMLVAAVLVRPAPAIMYLFFAARLGENAVNHSGLDSWLVDVLTLKVSLAG